MRSVEEPSPCLLSRFDALYEKRNSEAEEGKPVYRHNIESEYSKNHPEYVALVEKRIEKSSERSKVQSEKSDRQSFHSRLEQGRQEIENNEAE